MVHYNLLKLRSGADVNSIYSRCQRVYAELESELPFLHDAEVSRCVTERDSNADIMMVMHIDAPEQLGTYLRHPKHLALVQEMKNDVVDRMSFDEKEPC